MMSRKYLLLLLASSALSGTAAAQQATAPASPAPAKRGAQTEEIIVTAQRRAERLQRVPVSVSVLTAVTLAKQNVASQSDLRTVTPGLLVRAGQNSNALNYAIRGESLDPFSNAQPGVLPYFDEVQVGGPGGSSAFYDLQSVQVLKGPQGTLFGRNSTGGAVLFTSTRPSDEYGGYISGRFGNYSSKDVEGAVNIPIIKDEVMLRVAGVDQYREGFQHNLYNDSTVGKVSREGGRASLTVKPTDRLTNITVVDVLHSNGSPDSSVLYSLDPAGALPLIALTNASTMDATISALAGVPGLGNGSAALYFSEHPNLDRGGLASFIKTQQQLGPYDIDVDGITKYQASNVILSNVTTYDINADLQLKNVFGLTRLEQKDFSDTDGSPYGIDSNDPFGKIDNTHQLSEEAQVLGKAFGEKLTYAAGVYYQHENDYDFTTSNLLDFPIIHGIQINTSDQKVSTKAVYGQGTYNLSSLTGIDGLSATAGARFTSQGISIQILPQDVSFSAPAATQALYEPFQSKTYNNVSYTVGLQDQINSGLLAYVASRHSFKDGGYNGFVNPLPGLGDAGGSGYATETVTDIEVGAKYQGKLGDMPVNLDGAVYNDWITDGQHAASIIVGGAPAAITVNVPKSLVTGFELSGQIRPAGWLNLGASVNYEDARFTNDMVSVAGSAPVKFDTFPDAPHWSGTVYGEVTQPVSSRLTASFRTDVYYQTSQYFVGTGHLIPNTLLAGYALVNFRVGIDDVSGWSVSANLKNALGKTYYVGGEALGELFQVNMADPGDPRTYTVEASYKF